MKYLILTTFIVILFTKSNAQNILEQNELNNITITSNMQEQRQKESGRDVFVLKGDFFNKLPVHSIDELLKYIPGVEVQQRGAQGAQSDIVIRGGTFQQVLVIIDGLKLNDPLTGHFNATIPIHPAEIERIEVLKGASSALYGSEAVGGVIHIITKTFASKIKKEKSLQAEISAGQLETYNGSVYGKISSEQTSVSASVLSNNTQGQKLRGTYGYSNIHTANISLNHQYKKGWRINGRLAGDYRNFNAQNFYTTFVSDTANEKVQSAWMQWSLSKKTNQSLWQTDFAYKTLQDHYWYNPSSTPNENFSHLFTLQSLYSSVFDSKTNYTIGTQFTRKRILSNDRGNHSNLHGSVFAIFRHQLTNDFFINESLRFEVDENYGVALLPQINMAWSPGKLTLRASAGKSIRDADFTERYNNYNKPKVNSGSIGNPNLQEERAWNFEGGGDYQLLHYMKVSSSVFYRIQNQLIDWKQTQYNDMPRKENLVPGKVYALATNESNVKTQGFELDLIVSKQFNKNIHIYSSIGYTYLHSQNKDSIPSFYISSHAKHLLNWNGMLTFKKWNIALNGLYKERYSKSVSTINAYLTPSYFMMSSKISYTLPRKAGSLFFQIDNIFNQKYSDLLGCIMPGRVIMGGYALKL